MLFPCPAVGDRLGGGAARVFVFSPCFSAPPPAASSTRIGCYQCSWPKNHPAAGDSPAAWNSPAATSVLSLTVPWGREGEQIVCNIDYNIPLIVSFCGIFFSFGWFATLAAVLLPQAAAGVGVWFTDTGDGAGCIDRCCCCTVFFPLLKINRLGGGFRWLHEERFYLFFA